MNAQEYLIMIVSIIGGWSALVWAYYAFLKDIIINILNIFGVANEYNQTLSKLSPPEPWPAPTINVIEEEYDNTISKIKKKELII